MCGRARLSSDVSEIKLVFRIPPERPIPNIPLSWNVAPTDSLPVVRYDRKAGQRSLDLLRWGLDDVGRAFRLNVVGVTGSEFHNGASERACRSSGRVRPRMGKRDKWVLR